MRKTKNFTIAATVACLMAASLGIAQQPATAAGNEVTTLSGKGGIGEFAGPSGVAVAPDGTIYVADQSHFKIKKIVGQQISDFAKSSAFNTLDITNSFCSVAVKSSDEIFAIDCANTTLYKFNKAGQITRTYVVGLRNSRVNVGFRDWGGGLAVDNIGGIFLSDEYSHIIIRVDETTGVSTAYAGSIGISGNQDGSSDQARLNLPRGLAVDSQNNLYIADRRNSSIRKVTPQKIVSTIQSDVPCVNGVAIDSQDVAYAIGEYYCGAIITKVGYGRIFDDSKQSITSGVPGPTGKPTFAAISGIAIDRYGSNPTNNIYIADWANHKIRIFSSAGVQLGGFGSLDSFGSTNPNTPNQIYLFPLQTWALTDGTYLVADNYTIRHISGAGDILKVTRFEQACWYSAFAFGEDGTLYCTLGDKIMARFTDGTTTYISSGSTTTPEGIKVSANFKLIEGLAAYKGSIYFSERDGHLIRKVTRIKGTKNFDVQVILGTGVSANGPDVQQRSKATFIYPAKLAIDSVGNLYIADGGSKSIFKTSLEQNTDVVRIASGFDSWPTSLATDSGNSVFLSTEKGQIYRINNNSMSYLTGKGLGNIDGSLTVAQFNRPMGLSVDRDGSLIVADRDNNKIRKIEVGNTPGVQIFSPTLLSTYLKESSSSPLGFTAEQESNVVNKIMITNKTGLIGKYYLSRDSSPERSTDSLPLCEVNIAKTVSFNWGTTTIPNSFNCTVGRFVITYKGFLTWPGSGKQLRTISTASEGGTHVKIGDQVVVDNWSSTGGGSNFNYNKTSTLTLEGGKQYPIEVWYLSPQKGRNASLNLLWSTVASGDPATNVIVAEKYLSPTKLESDEPLTLPVKATSPKITINLNLINITVRVPASASSIKLFAPEFGVTATKPIVGTINNGMANFEIALSSKYAGKKGALQIVTGNAAGDSSPLKVPVNVPKITNKPAPKVTPSARPQEVQKQPEVTCLKGGTKRTFDGTACPPGYTKA